MNQITTLTFLDIEPSVEKMAREILISGGRDPEILVQPGTPEIYGTPSGEVYTVVPGTEVQLWRMYIASARTMLALARKVDAAITVV